MSNEEAIPTSLSSYVEVLSNIEQVPHDDDTASFNHKCTTCNKEFLNGFLLNEHMTMHVKSNQHSCNECGEVFSEKSSLCSHELNEHADKSPKFGGTNVPTEVPLTNHLQTQTLTVTYATAQKRKKKLLKSRSTNWKISRKKNVQQFPCHFCGKMFDYRSSLSNHMRSHSGVKVTHTKKIAAPAALPLVSSDPDSDGTVEQPPKLLKFQCPTCKILCRTNQDILTHMETHEHKLEVLAVPSKSTPKEKLSVEVSTSFKCDTCDMKFKSRGSLFLHSRKHKKQNLDIPNVTASVPNLSETNSSNTYTCLECLSVCLTSRSLYNHRLTHISKRSYKGKGVVQSGHKCQECGVSYRTKYRLQRHLPSHEKAFPFKCNMCSATYKHKNALSLHQKMHDKSQLYATCVSCKFMFRSCAVLEEHVRVRHTRKQEFECSVCQSQFSKKVDLSLHMALHARQVTYAQQEAVLKVKSVPSMPTTFAKKNYNNVASQDECKICWKKLKYKCSLILHMKKIHNKLYCRVCCKFINENRIVDVSNSKSKYAKKLMCIVCLSKGINKGNPGERLSVATADIKISDLVSETLTLLVDKDFLLSEGIFDKRIDQQLEAIVEACDAEAIKSNCNDSVVQQHLLENVKRLIVVSIGHEDAKVLFQYKSVETILCLMLATLQKL